MSKARLALGLALAGGAATLLAALAFQYIGGMRPCPLCMDQRYAQAAGMAGTLAALLAPRRGAAVLAAALGGLAFFTESAIAAYHSGVERKFWGSTCSGADVPAAFSLEDLTRSIESGAGVAPRCDEVAWADPVLGLSMANWNILVAAGLGMLCLWAALRLYGSSSASQ